MASLNNPLLNPQRWA